MSADAESRGLQQTPAGEWGWDENEPVSSEQHDLVWEGFDSGRRLNGPPPIPMQEMVAENGVDPVLDARAGLIAREMRQRNGVWPTKKRVADELAREVGMQPATVLRRIRKPRQ